MFTWWHNWLDMERFDKAWHEQDMADELAEYYEARGFVERWSELSDVVYTYTRAAWSGHRSEVVFPFPQLYFWWGALYMLPKYTLRWLFFRRAGTRAGSPVPIRAVRNPHKTEKLDQIAQAHGCNTEKFRAECEKQLKYWPLLK